MDIGMRSLHPAAADHSMSIRGSRCTALIILSLRSRAVVFSLLLFLSASEKLSVTAQQRWSRSHGRKRNGSREDSHTRSVRWPAPLRASALKERISLKSTRVIASTLWLAHTRSLASSCLHTGTWCSSTSACWAFGSTGKRANSCQRRGSIFSAWSSIRSTKQHASPRNVLSQCWTASRPYQAGRRFHWNSFRGSWGIWLQLRWQFRSVCSIWDRFSTGSMAESRGGRGNAALTGFRLHRPAARPSGRGQIPRSFGQECPWGRYPGMLWYSQMPRPQAGEPRTTGTQYQGFGRVPNCIGISIASSC